MSLLASRLRLLQPFSVATVLTFAFLTLSVIMSEGLFDSARAAPEEAATPQEKKPKRTKLFSYDSVAAQVLEPFGSNNFDDMSLEAIWKSTLAGNSKTAYYSHLCADGETDGWHIGAGISQTAAALLSAIEHYKHEHVRAMLQKTICDKIDADIKGLEPHLAILNMGRGSQKEKNMGSFRAAKKARLTSDGRGPVSEADVKAAAKAVHQWLSLTSSPFRSFLYLTGKGNVFYGAHVAEVVARAAIAHKPLGKDAFIAAVVARASKPEETATGQPATGSSGLFD